MIRYEVDYDLFGVGEARRRIALADPQTKAALGDFDKAAKLLEAYRR
jgi:hypothetical protein